MQSKATLPTRAQVAAVVSGNALEFYDFLSFSFFSVNLARVMFPKSEPATALLLTLMSGSLGFFARPFGAVLFGLVGDRFARRPSMLATFALMGVAGLSMALTPSYASIGVAAPILVVIFRLLQGLAVGGDVGPTTAFLAESVPVQKRGAYICLQIVAMRLGVVFSAVVGMLLSTWLDVAGLDRIGWRIAFGLGAAIVPLVFFMRRKLEETLHLPEEGPHWVKKFSPARYAGALLGVAGFLLSGAIGDFIFVYSVTWRNFPPLHAYSITMCIASVQVAGVWCFSKLGDRWGRRPLMLVSGLALMTIARPLFHWAVIRGDAASLALACSLLAGCGALGCAGALPSFVEITPKHMRSSLVGIGYGLVVAVVFGLVPVVTARHMSSTGDLATPAYAWMLGGLLLLVSAMLGNETAPQRRSMMQPA